MTKKTPLTYEDHTALGRELHELRNQLQQRSIQLMNAYPKTDQAVKKIRAAVDLIDHARGEMENHLFQEHPEVADTTVYYPGPADDRT